MKLDTTTKILDLKGNPMLSGDKTPVTVGDCITGAMINGPYANDNPSNEDKLARFNIAVTLAKGGVVDLTDIQFVTIRDVIGKAHFPLIVGRVNEILDKASK